MLQKINLRRNGQVVHRMEEEEVEIAAEIAAEIVAVTEEDAAEVVIAVAQLAADTRKATADQVTGRLTKVAEIAEAIQAIRQPVRIRKEVAAGLLEENRGIRNKPGNRVRRRRGFSLLR